MVWMYNDHLGENISRGIRNKVILRKKYQREVKRLASANEARHQGYLSKKKVYDAKIQRLQSRLAPMAAQYAITHPGQTLALDAKRKEVKIASDTSLSAVDLAAARMLTTEG